MTLHGIAGPVVRSDQVMHTDLHTYCGKEVVQLRIGSAAITISRTSDAQYTVRRSGGGELGATELLDELTRVLMTDGPADETVSLLIEGGRGIETVLADRGYALTSIGWEGLLVASPNRRRVNLPAGFTATTDAPRVGWDRLIALRPNAAWVHDSPSFSLEDTVVLYRDGEVVGWVPVWRVSTGTSVVRFVVIQQGIYADQERRLTHLRLATYAHTLESEFSKGRTVLSWMPDDGDPVNDLKVSLGAPLKVTHWFATQVRRDFRAAGATNL